MIFSCTQENFFRGLNIVGHIASKNVNLPILHNVLITASSGGVQLVATNLEIGAKANVRGKVEGEGSFTVPAQILANYIGLVSAERIDVEKNKNELIIKADNQQTKIKGEEALDFPIVPEVERENMFVLPISDVKNALSQTLVAVAHDDSRPELTGVNLRACGQEVVFAATDSYRLAESRAKVNSATGGEKNIIVPAAALLELARIINDGEKELTLFIGENQAMFVVDGIELTTRLIDGNYPDYEQLIPQQQRTTIIINRQAAIKAVKAASLFSRSGINDISLHFSADNQEVTLSTVNNQVGENVTKVAAKVTGESNHIVFNYRYLLDGLTQTNSAEIEVGIIDNSLPGVFKPVLVEGTNNVGAGRFVYIIMPIKQ